MLGMLRNCGATGHAASLLALLALACASAALAVAVARRSRAAGLLAALGLVLCGCTSMTGFAGTLLGRKATQDAVASAALSPSNVALARSVGFAEARDCARLGAGAALLPFLLGVSAAALALFRAPSEAPEAPAGDRAPAAEGASPTPRASVPLVLAGAAFAFTGLLASGGLATASVGGASYEPAVWSLMTTSERVVSESGSLTEPCQAFEAALGQATAERIATVVDVPEAAERCVRARLTLLAAAPPSDRAVAGRALEASPLLRAARPETRAALTLQIRSLSNAAD